MWSVRWDTQKAIICVIPRRGDVSLSAFAAYTVIPANAGIQLFQGLDPRLRGNDGLNETSAVSFPSAAARQQAGLEFFQQGIAQRMQFTQTP